MHTLCSLKTYFSSYYKRYYRGIDVLLIINLKLCFSLLPLFFTDNEVEVDIIQRRSIKDKNVDLYNLEILLKQILLSMVYSIMAGILNAIIKTILNLIHSKEIKIEYIENQLKYIKNVFIKIISNRKINKSIKEKLYRAKIKLKFIVYLKINALKKTSKEKAKALDNNDKEYIDIPKKGYSKDFLTKSKYENIVLPKITNNRNYNTERNRFCFNNSSSHLMTVENITSQNVPTSYQSSKKNEVVKKYRKGKSASKFQRKHNLSFSSPNLFLTKYKAGLIQVNRNTNYSDCLTEITTHRNILLDNSNNSLRKIKRKNIQNKLFKKHNRKNNSNIDINENFMIKEKNKLLIKVSISEEIRITIKNILGTVVIFTSWAFSVIFVKKIYQIYRNNIVSIVVIPVFSTLIMNLIVTEAIMILIFSILSWINFEKKYFGVSGIIHKVLSIVINPLIQKQHQIYNLLKDIEVAQCSDKFNN